MDKILNVPNAQRTLSAVRKRLNEVNNTKPYVLDDIKYYYKLADKENKEGRRSFKLLNYSKDDWRSLRNEENSLILINKLLKKFIYENREESSQKSNENIIQYLPTVYEFNRMLNVLVNKLFPIVSYKDVKRWFKNNPYESHIKLFEVKITDNKLTNIIGYYYIYREYLKNLEETIKDHSFIFTADCFSTGNSGFISTGHRKEYVQKCIDLYGNVLCKFKDKLIDDENPFFYTTTCYGIEQGEFQCEFFRWKYVDVTIENFR